MELDGKTIKLQIVSGSPSLPLSPPLRNVVESAGNGSDDRASVRRQRNLFVARRCFYEMLIVMGSLRCPGVT